VTTYVILLRAVNLAGHGKLPMADFRKLLTALGFEKVETYIQSGNAVVDAKGSAASVAKAVAAGLEKLMGTPAGVVVRTQSNWIGWYARTLLRPKRRTDQRCTFNFWQDPAGRKQGRALSASSHSIRSGTTGTIWPANISIFICPMVRRRQSSAARRSIRRSA